MPYFFSDEQAALLDTPETRRLVMSDGSTRELTYSYFIWSVVYDGLIDAGYTDELLIAHAEVAGWDPPDLPFDVRFRCVISDVHNRRIDQRFKHGW